MNDKTGGNRGPRRAAALAVMAAAAVLATGCGARFGPSAARPAQSGPVTVAQELALAQCMRGHGVPSFPDPGAGGFHVNASLLSSGTVLTAYGACRHLLAGGGPSIAQLQQDAQNGQQAEQKALPALVKFAQCMRGHGVPGFPDPPASGQSAPAAPKTSGINASSPRFQAAVSACQHVLPAGAHLSFGTHATSVTPQP
jgi:hypothetical protein